jgi:hypothetical protein
MWMSETDFNRMYRYKNEVIFLERENKYLIKH